MSLRSLTTATLSRLSRPLLNTQLPTRSILKKTYSRSFNSVLENLDKHTQQNPPQTKPHTRTTLLAEEDDPRLHQTRTIIPADQRVDMVHENEAKDFNMEEKKGGSVLDDASVPIEQSMKAFLEETLKENEELSDISEEVEESDIWKRYEWEVNQKIKVLKESYMASNEPIDKFSLANYFDQHRSLVVAVREKYIKEFKEERAKEIAELRFQLDNGLISPREVRERLEEKKLIREKQLIARRKARAKRNKEELEWVQKPGWADPPEHIRKLEKQYNKTVNQEIDWTTWGQEQLDNDWKEREEPM